MPGPSPRPSRKRDEITATARELFRRFGIRRVSVTEICREAGVSRVTFYKHFANKVELAKHVIDEWSDQIIARLDELEAADIPFSEKIRRFIEHKLQTAREIGPELFEELYGADESLRPFLRERGRKNLERFVRFIGDAQTAGDIRPELRPELILVVLERLNDLARDPELLALYPDHVALTRDVHHLFFYGVLAEMNAGLQE